MLGAIAALALWTGLFHPDESRHIHGDMQTSQYRLDNWQVKIVENRFSGEKHCTAERSDVAFDHGVLTFYFPRSMNTANAVFRVDWGELKPVGAGLVAASGLGAHVQTTNFGNPSNGEVFIPYSYVGDAAIVAIKPNNASIHRVFKVDGLKSVVSAMQSRGCPAFN